MKIGIIIAMEKEFEQVKGLLNEPKSLTFENRHFVYGTIGLNTVILMQSGIGKVNAAVGTWQMIEKFTPDMIISTGVAGGASLELEVQDVVVSTETCYHDVYCGKEVAFGQVIGMPARFKCPEDIVIKATALDCGTRIHAGLIVTGDWFVDTVEKMRSIIGNFPDAMAVDMESAAIAHTCKLQDTPFISFRIISDIPLKEGNTEQYYNFWETMANKSFNATKALLNAL